MKTCTLVRRTLAYLSNDRISVSPIVRDEPPLPHRRVPFRYQHKSVLSSRGLTG